MDKRDNSGLDKELREFLDGLLMMKVSGGESRAA